MAQGDKKGLLFASFDFSAAHADEFHDWYDLEHIPERMRVPGFINAERWIGDENPQPRPGPLRHERRIRAPAELHRPGAAPRALTR